VVQKSPDIVAAGLTGFRRNRWDRRRGFCLARQRLLGVHASPEPLSMKRGLAESDGIAMFVGNILH